MSTQARTMASLREQVLTAARDIGHAFTVADLVETMAEDWPARSVNTMLAELSVSGALTKIRAYPARVYTLGAQAAANPSDPAPDWGRGYPSGGAQIGPTWQAMWEAMADGAWHDVHELVPIGEAAADCTPETVRNQLFAAARHGLIEPEGRQDSVTNRWRIWYRRTDRSEVAS